jgi:spermidine synthase
LANRLDNPKVKIFREDGKKFIREKNEYDPSFVDSTDPVGPAKVLFRKDFLEAMFKPYKMMLM